jgi:hypothetical protein
MRGSWSSHPRITNREFKKQVTEPTQQSHLPIVEAHLRIVGKDTIGKKGDARRILDTHAEAK